MGVSVGSLIFFVAVFLSPVYLFPSGLPQPADLVFLLFAGYVVLNALYGRQEVRLPGFTLLWGALVLWVSVVAVSWAIIDGDGSLAFRALYYVYNLVVGVSVILFFRGRQSTEKVVIVSFVAALLLSFLGAIVDLGFGVRVTGFFNNPNQLGYFSLLSMAIVAVASRFSLSAPVAMVGMVSGLIAAMAASSLAAWGGLLFLLAAYVVQNSTGFSAVIKGVGAVASGVIAVLVVDVMQQGSLMGNVEARLDRAPDKVSEVVEERRYDRVLAHPEYWVLGAGEANQSSQRFGGYAGAEVHSSLGALLLAYGAGPLLIFLFMLGILVKRAPLSVGLVVLGVIFYSLTHMGLRFTPFWLLLAVIYVLYVDRLGRRSARNGVSPNVGAADA